MSQKVAIFLLLLAAFAGGIYLTDRVIRAKTPNDPITMRPLAASASPSGAQFSVKTDETAIKDPGAIANAAAVVEPSVVTIDTEYRPRLRYNGDESPAASEDETAQQIPRGTGSGVILSSDGIIVTNNHVVENATKISVTLNDGREMAGRVLGTDPQSDLAVVKIDEKNLPAVTLADSDKVRVGEWAVAVGDPLRVGITVTAGIVSAIRKNQLTGPGTSYATLIQTDAAINPGNSGGALADIRGRLIGINSAIRSNTGGSIGIGYAIPSNTMRDITSQLIEKGHVTRPWLGVGPYTLTELGRQQLNLQTVPGSVIIGQVQPGSPAYQAGLVRGDVILSVNDMPVKAAEDVLAKIRGSKVGDTLRLLIWRGGAQRTVSVTLEERPYTQPAR